MEQSVLTRKTLDRLAEIMTGDETQETTETAPPQTGAAAEEQD